MATIEVTVHCGLCSNEHTTPIKMPPGWEHRYGGIDDEMSGFCPDHAKVAAFAEAQCPGCVGGWGDCEMWSAFAFKGRYTITEADFATLERGICPKRINGTIGINHGRMETIDLSDRAPAESGKAFADAIREYVRRYHDLAR